MRMVVAVLHHICQCSLRSHCKTVSISTPRSLRYSAGVLYMQAGLLLYRFGPVGLDTSWVLQ